MAKLRVSFVNKNQAADNAITLQTIQEWLQQKGEEPARIVCLQPPYIDETAYQINVENRSLCWKPSIDANQTSCFKELLYLALEKEQSTLFARTRNLDCYVEYNQ